MSQQPRPNPKKKGETETKRVLTKAEIGFVRGHTRLVDRTLKDAIRQRDWPLAQEILLAYGMFLDQNPEAAKAI